eukprot:5987225-Heterocapsa_arctica.AAC.1
MILHTRSDKDHAHSYKLKYWPAMMIVFIKAVRTGWQHTEAQKRKQEQEQAGKGKRPDLGVQGSVEVPGRHAGCWLRLAGPQLEQSPVDGRRQLGRLRRGQVRRMAGGPLRCGGQDGDGQVDATVNGRQKDTFAHFTKNEARIAYCDQRQIDRNTRLYWLRYSKENGDNFKRQALLGNQYRRTDRLKGKLCSDIACVRVPNNRHRH